MPQFTHNCPRCGALGLTCRSPAVVYQTIGTCVFNGKRHLDYDAWDSDGVEFTDTGTVFCNSPRCDWSCTEDQLLKILFPQPTVWP